MGAQESKTHNGNANHAQGDNPTETVQDYYALLEVSQSATADEIKASVAFVLRNYPEAAVLICYLHTS
jgi:hypothetical protein